jgi:hypothetical protein
MTHAGALVLIALSLGACSTPARKESAVTHETHAATDDARLIARVRAAIDAHVPADRLASYVGQVPLIDTTAGASLQALQGVDFAQDPEHADQRFDRANARAVVYWRRPVAGDDPKVVGVQFGDGDAARMFFAIILPPG